MLVVDDEPAIRLLCRVNLELDGFEVREAGSLAAARAALAEGDVDVVLLDMHIGLDHGGDLLDEIAGAVPVAAVTGSVELGDGRYQAADARLPKPFEIDELRRVVAELAAR